MGPSMKTLTLIIRYPGHRVELMRVEWNANKSAGWLEIGIHTVARMFNCRTLFCTARQFQLLWMFIVGG